MSICMMAVQYVWHESTKPSWRHFPCYWPSNYKGPMRWSLIFSLMLAWTICGTNNRIVGDLRRHEAQVTHPRSMPWPFQLTALTGELWGVFRELFEEKWPRYVERALYTQILCSDWITCATDLAPFIFQYGQIWKKTYQGSVHTI